MDLVPNLFKTMDPPEIHVILEQVTPALEDTRRITIRIKPYGEPSLVLFGTVDRYSPEWSIFRAISEMLLALEQEQKAVTTHMLTAAWQAASEAYIAPF